MAIATYLFLLNQAWKHHLPGSEWDTPEQQCELSYYEELKRLKLKVRRTPGWRGPSHTRAA